MLYLHMDDIVGGQVLDVSGQANHGTIYGAGAAVGKRGMGLSFDGVNDYVDGGNKVSLSNDATFCAWINQNSLTGTQGIVSKQTNYEVYFGAGNLRFYNGSVITSSYTNSINNWVFVAVTISNNVINFYVNGALNISKTGSLGSTNNNNFNIGAYNSASDWFKGTIDEVMIHNRALTPGEIKYNYLGCRDIMSLAG